MASRIRRKPQVTYKSPTAEDHALISLSLGYSRSSSPLSTTKSNQLRKSPDKNSHIHSLRIPTRLRYSTTPSLPLFHPFGRLAMSLPPLDTTRYNLPVPAIPDEMDSKRASRGRRPASKIREVQQDEAPPIASSVSTIAAVAAREVKERPSPRKRRAGGAKRKRKDPDDGDATYPAKRTRIPRGVAAPGDEEALVDGPQVEEAEPPSPPEAVADREFSETATKRRSTRSKGSLKRRGSSTSDTPSVSGTTNIIAPSTESIKALNSAETAPKSDATAANSDDKEDGELSEVHPNL